MFLGALVPAAGEAVSGLGATIVSFREAVQREFLPSADLHRQIARTMNEAVSKLDAAIVALGESSATLKDTVGQQKEGVAAMKTLLASGLAPATAAIGQAAGALADSSAQLVGRVDQIGAAMQSAVASLGGMVASAGEKIAGIEPAVGAFADAVQEQVVPSARACGQGMTDLAAAAAQFKHVTQAIQGVAGMLEGVIATHGALAARLDPSCRALAETIARHYALGESLGQSFEEGLIPAEQSLRDAAQSVQGSAERLAEFIREGVEPATRRLVQFEETLVRVQQAADRLPSAAPSATSLAGWRKPRPGGGNGRRTGRLARADSAAAGPGRPPPRGRRPGRRRLVSAPSSQGINCHATRATLRRFPGCQRHRLGVQHGRESFWA